MAKIILWLGPSVERFDPLTAIETGIGGSETAAIHLSRELAKYGHEVVVYADVAPVSDVVSFNGNGNASHGNVVRWRPYHQAAFHESCDVFISSRQPGARRKLLPHCKQAWLWMHDIHCGPDWENLIGVDYDKILCLSKFARNRFLEYYPGVEPTKVVQTSNGLDVSFFEKVENQHTRFQMGLEPLRVTYSSSLDRGLDKLLSLWPSIRDLSPAAELHVYYGFETWRRLATLHGPQGQLARIEFLEDRLKRTPGVFFHGRVGQAELAKSFLQSHLWLYPTDFVETSCITAMEAQAARCKIVTTRCGALPETVPGAWFVDGPTSAPDFDRQFLESTWAALWDDSVVTYPSKSWADVAKQWAGWIP